MENTKKNNLITKFLSDVKIKKFLLAVYCVVPILILSVGFAAWQITGNETFGANGSFVSYPIINSYDYVPELNFSTEGNGLYPTRFYKTDENGKLIKDENGDPVPVIAAKIDVTATINLSECRKLLNERKNKDVIYAEFTLSFSNGTGDMSTFFKNLSLEVSDESSNKITKDGGSITINNINVKNNDDDTFTSYKATISNTVETTNTSKTTLGSFTNSSYTVKLQIKFEKTGTSTSANDISTDLKLTYTLDPEKASDYQTLYNTLVDSNLQFMVDVKITDINPGSSTNNSGN